MKKVQEATGEVSGQLTAVATGEVDRTEIPSFPGGGETLTVTQSEGRVLKRMMQYLD